jgi:hypothetical protein
MTFCNLLQGTMTIAIFHGSPNKLTFKLNIKQNFNKLKYDFRLFLVHRFFKWAVLLSNVFVLSHLPC